MMMLHKESLKISKDGSLYQSPYMTESKKHLPPYPPDPLRT